MIKTVKFKIATSAGQLDWTGYSTEVEGLLIGKPLGEDNQPALFGWLIYHEKSGLYVNSDILKNLFDAKNLVKSLSHLDWTKSDSEIDKDLYLEAINKASPVVEPYLLPKRIKASQAIKLLDYPKGNVLLNLGKGLGIDGNLLKSLLGVLGSEYVTLLPTENSLIVYYSFGRAELKNCFEYMFKKKEKRIFELKITEELSETAYLF